MAAYTSSQSGNWDVAATWGGAGVPGASDTATITGQHTVTVPVGYSGTCGAITMSAGVSGTRTKLQINGTFDLAGDVAVATYCDINLGAGAILDFNGYAINRATSAIVRFNWIGTGEVRSSVISTGSRGTIPTAAAHLFADMRYTDISGMGDCEYGRTHTTVAVLNYQYCTWTDCGYIWLDGTGNQTNQGFLVSHCDFRNPASDAVAQYPYLYQTGAKGTNPRTVEYCTWDTNRTVAVKPDFRAPGALMTHNVFVNAEIQSRNATLEYISNFFSDLLDGHIFAETANTLHAKLEGNYTYQGAVSVHPFGYQVATNSFSWLDNVFEVEPGGLGYGTNWTLSTVPFTGTVTVQGNLWLGNAGTVMTFTQAGAAGTIDISNNTLYVDNDAEGDDFPVLFLTEQTGNISGGTISIYNNLLVDPDSSTTPDKAIYLRTNTAAQIDTCDYNGGWAYPAGTQIPPLKYYDSDGVMSELGANDVSIDPKFVAKTRKLATWDGALGGPGTAANAIAELLKLNQSGYNSAYNVAALVAWVREGFAPRNAALATAGQSGGLIGAIAVAPPAWKLAGAEPGKIAGVDASGIASVIGVAA